MIGGRVLFVGFEGTRLTGEERGLLARVEPAGLVLFARNVGEAGELGALTQDLRRSLPNTILAVDSEGGRVDRLCKVVGPAPAAAELARLPPAGARRAGRWIGAALAAFGFDLDLAPVVDVDHGRKGNALDGRCLGAGPRRVTVRAAAFLDGLHASGVGGCLKHFPGLGDADLDTHEAPARVEKSRSELLRDLEPYRRLARGTECALVGHAIYPALDPLERPASLSPAIASGRFRAAAGLRRALLSDDLEMGALGAWGTLPEIGGQALAAGCDGLLFCRRLEEAPAIAERLAAPALRRRLEEAIGRMARLRRDLDTLRRRADAPPPIDRVAARLRQLSAAAARA